MGRILTEIPGIERRSDGVWYVHWYDAEARQTRRRSLKTRDAREAAAGYAHYLLTWSGDANHGRMCQLRHVLEYYIKNHIDTDAADRERTRHARKPLEKYFNDALLRSIDVPACYAYAAARRAMGRSDSTVRRELYVISAAANFALLHKRIAEEDLPTVWAPKETPARKSFLSERQLKLAYTTADAVLQDFIALAYFTGARRRAIEHLTVQQVDLEHALVDLMPPDATPAEQRSKKHKPILPILSEYRDRIARLIEGKAPNDRILPEGNYYYQFKKHLSGLGLPSKSYPHVLRHSRATHLLQEGIPIYAVAKLLGDTVATVERSYSHHSTDYLARILDGKGPKLG